MDNENNEVVASQNDETTDTQSEATSTETVDVATLQKEKAELETKNRQLFERAKKAEGFVLKDGHWFKPQKAAPSAQETEHTGELDDTTGLLLEVKGIKEDDETELFVKWRRETGRQPREILNSGIFQAELQALRTERATQAAIPSGNGRGGGAQAHNIGALAEKFEKTGELPKDFDLKNKVLNQVGERHSMSVPPWRR